MSYSKYGDLPQKEKEVVDDICIHIKSHEHRKGASSQMKGQKTPHICIIDNYTTWCGPCKMVAPKYIKLAHKYTNTDMSKPTIVFCKENAEDKIPGQMEIRGVPCFHFFVNGAFVSDLTVTGADIGKVEENILRILDKFSGNSKQ